MASASVVQFTVDDSSPVILYSPFGDTFGAPQLDQGWNPHWDSPGFSSASTGSTGTGTSLHVTSLNNASFEIQWKGTGIKLFGNVTQSSYNINIDGTVIDAGALADLSNNTLLDINNLSDASHTLALTVQTDGAGSLFTFDRALISAPVPPSNVSSLPFIEQVLNNTAFAFHGDWSSRTSTTAGDSASVQFTGTSFLLRGSTSPQAGSYSVTLDNVTTSFSAKSAFTETDSLLFFASGLDAETVHDFEIVNTEGATLVLPAGGASVFALQNPPSASSSASTPSASTSSALAQSGLSSGTIAALVLAGVLIFFIVLCALLYFLLFRPYRRRRLLQRHPPKDDFDQDAGSVLVVDVAPDATMKKGYYYEEYNVPAAGPSRDRTSKRSGFAKWKEEVEGGFGSLGRLGIAFRHSDSTGRRDASGSSHDYDVGATSDGGYKSTSSSNDDYPTTSGKGKGKGREGSRWTRRSDRDKSLSPRFKLDLPIEHGSRSGSNHSNAPSAHADPSIISSLSYLSSPSIHATNLPSNPSSQRPSPYPNTQSRVNSNGALLTHTDLDEPEPPEGEQGYLSSPPLPPLPPLPSSALLPQLPTPPTDSPRQRHEDRGSVRDYDVDDGRSILGDGTARIALRSLSPRTSEAEHRKVRSKRRAKEKKEKEKAMTSSPLAKPPVDAPASHLDLEPTTPPPDSVDTGLVLRSTSPFRVDFDQAGNRVSGQSRVRFEAEPATAAQQGREEAEASSSRPPESAAAAEPQPPPSRAPFRLTPASDHLRDTSFLDFASSSEGSIMSRDRSNGYSSSSRSFSSVGPSGHWSTGGASSNIASLVPPPQPVSRWSATTAPSSDIQIEGSGSSSASNNFPFPVSLPASPHHPEGTFLPPPAPGQSARNSGLSSLNAHPSDLAPSIPTSPTESDLPLSISDIHFRHSDTEDNGGSRPYSVPAHPPLPPAQPVEEVPYIVQRVVGTTPSPSVGNFLLNTPTPTATRFVSTPSPGTSRPSPGSSARGL